MVQLEEQQPATEYKVPRPGELQSVLRTHELWLNTRDKPSTLGSKGCLSNCDLTNYDFGEFRLEQVIFEHVSMRGRKFDNVNLSGCHFVNVDLSRAEFTDVDLSFAQFTQKTDLSDAILAPEGLNQTIFSDVILDNTEFRFRMNAKPEHACQFRNCKGSRTLFKDAILNNVEFKRNQFQSANFKGAKLTSVSFSGGTYTRCDFSGIRFETPGLIQQQVEYRGSKFEGAVIAPESGFSGCEFTHDGDEPCSFQKATLRGVRLENSTFRKVDFESANLEEAFLSNIAVDGSNFNASTGLYGRHKATLQGVKGAQNARYLPRYDFCTWSLVRTIGSIPLFGVSYFAVIAIILLVSLTKTYNLQVNAFKQTLESTPTAANNDAVNQHEHVDDGGPRNGDTPRWSDKLQEIKLPDTLMRTLGALCLLAIGSTVYRVACPHEIQENTLVKWVRELKSPEIEYRALAAKGVFGRWTSGVCLSIGASYLLYHIICRVRDAFVFLWAHAS